MAPNGDETRARHLGGGHDERAQTLNQILGEMDGFEGHEAVIVPAATNRPDVLDPPSALAFAVTSTTGILGERVLAPGPQEPEEVLKHVGFVIDDEAVLAGDDAQKRTTRGLPASDHGWPNHQARGPARPLPAHQLDRSQPGRSSRLSVSSSPSRTRVPKAVLRDSGSRGAGAPAGARLDAG
jgi:hypothetical protein